MIIINDKMLKYCREARSRYRNFFDENKKDAEKSVEDIKKTKDLIHAYANKVGANV